MKVLVTGGAGYIGSTVCSALKDRGHTPIILDSLITGESSYLSLHQHFKGDISDREVVKKIRLHHPDCETVVHCAARIIVNESVQDPALYHRENVGKSIDFLSHCLEFGFRSVLFSSSASIYGITESPGVKEDTLPNPASPYARTKAIFESILSDFCVFGGIRGLSLRYFNPIGADPKFRTGPFIEDPSHLLGRLLDSASDEDAKFTIFGENWPTRDGSCIRDFIHVWDLANAHVNAVEYLNSSQLKVGYYDAINLGTGQGTTVKEFVELFKKTIGKDFKVIIGEPREGDVAGAFAIVEKAHHLLNWIPKLTIEQGIRDAIAWKEIRSS